MVVVKPTGRGGKPLKPKPIKPKKKRDGGAIEKSAKDMEKQKKYYETPRGAESEAARKYDERRMSKKSTGGMSNKPKKPKIIQLMPKGVFYKGKAKDYPGIKELIKRKNKKAAGGEMLKNPKKADLDKDGKLSSYEKKRGMAIEQNMKPKKAMGGGMMKYSKGGGADTGKEGEAKSNLSSAIRNLKKRIGMRAPKRPPMNPAKKAMGGEMKRGYGAARTSGMGLQDENLTPGKTMDYYKDLM